VDAVVHFRLARSSSFTYWSRGGVGQCGKSGDEGTALDVSGIAEGRGSRQFVAGRIQRTH
jgi:hypothetical protein